MNDRDKVIIEKILGYCNEIKQTHELFKNDKETFNSEEGFVYRNSITMPILLPVEQARQFLQHMRKQRFKMRKKN